MAALAGDQRAIKLCSVSAADEALPNLPSGQTQQITLMAFVERNQQVTSILLGNATDVVGRVCVKDTVAVACP